MRPISEERAIVEEQDRRSAGDRPQDRHTFTSLLKVPFFKNVANRALDPKIERVEMVFNVLPEGFEGTRLLLLTDLHVDGECGSADKLLKLVGKLDYDYCFLGGDYAYSRDGDCSIAYSEIRHTVTGLTQRSEVFAVLGNYDRYPSAELLNDCGAKVLMNEGVSLERNGDKIYLAGLDDCSHHKSDDIELADRKSWDGAFKIMLCHSPAKYREAANAAYAAYLAGDTHGGQICLPGGVPLVRFGNIPREMIKGKWHYKGLAGYTSRGVGTSRIRVRLFCPPEITVITLKTARSSYKSHTSVPGQRSCV